MPYDEQLAEKVRSALADTKGIQEKQMFGGIAFMRGGAMCIGVNKDDLIVRCEKEETDELLKKKGVRVFDLSGGRPMKGWLLVGREASRTQAGLQAWVDFALAGSQKSKKAPTKRTTPRKKKK
jgi:TfoX/Sxy family transcriptional regulator of competence genes